MDYGAPVGYRIAESHPERVTALIVQNGNAYDEGLLEFWDPIKQYWASGSKEDGDALRSLLTLDATQWQYQHGTRNPESISPDNWLVVQPLLDRPGNQEIQLAMFYDYRTNIPLYPRWQRYFRTHLPPTLIGAMVVARLWNHVDRLPYLHLRRDHPVRRRQVLLHRDDVRHRRGRVVAVHSRRQVCSLPQFQQ